MQTCTESLNIHSSRRVKVVRMLNLTSKTTGICSLNRLSCTSLKMLDLMPTQAQAISMLLYPVLFMFALSLKGLCDADVLSMFHDLVSVLIFVVAAEFVRLAELPLLEDLVFVGNPLQEKYASDQNNWIEEATKRVPKLKKLDGEFGA